MSKPCILVTRPEEDATTLAHMLEASGYATLSEPMLKLSPVEAGVIALREMSKHHYQGIIATSRHALPALEPFRRLQELPLFVVGEATARAGVKYGFTIIHTAPTVQALLPIITRHASPGTSPLIYVRGQHITQDLEVQLPRQYALTQCIVYRMLARTQLSDALVDALQQGSIHAATFLSVRTAEAFAALCAPHAERLSSINAVAYSAQIATALSALPWKRIYTAAEPTLASLAAEVDNACAER
jgi:uroporphyrinogen-III synthase